MCECSLTIQPDAALSEAGILECDELLTTWPEKFAFEIYRFFILFKCYQTVDISEGNDDPT